jgi:EAL domain-containing protein (putative c-di-GMP-specific phosphodiesterase class I)
MYDAKAARRRSPARLSDEGDPGAELRRALDAGELVLHFQPVHEVRRGPGGLLRRAVGAEALVRWHHPQRGVLGPDEFVPQAERTGLVAERGRHVLRSAAATAAGWDRDGLLPDGFRVHVNVAVAQLHASLVLDSVTEALAATGLQPARLCLELTEAGLLDVREFTPAVAGLRTSPRADAVVEAVVTLAQRLGITPVAEGVEALGQLERLVGLRCTRAQGYLFGRPEPAQAWERVLLTGDRPVEASSAVPAPRSAASAAATAS